MGKIYKYPASYERVVQPMPEFRDVAGNLLKEGDRVFYATGTRSDSLSEGIIVKISDYEQANSTRDSSNNWVTVIHHFPEYLVLQMKKGSIKPISYNCVKA